MLQEMFSYWLDSGEGKKPKQWGTLLRALKNIKDLTAAVEEIDTELSMIHKTTRIIVIK